jgi:hypothetical protein
LITNSNFVDWITGRSAGQWGELDFVEMLVTFVNHDVRVKSCRY